MEKVGALWKKKTKKKGIDYLRGNCKGIELVIFSNDEKRSDKSPDYLIYLAEKKEGSK